MEERSNNNRWHAQFIDVNTPSERERQVNEKSNTTTPRDKEVEVFLGTSDTSLRSTFSFS